MSPRDRIRRGGILLRPRAVSSGARERDYSALLHRAPENVFAVKATWWIGL